MSARSFAGSLSKPAIYDVSPPRDETLFQDDIGRFTNSSVTHEDHYALVITEDGNFDRDVVFNRPMNYVQSNWVRDDGGILTTVALARTGANGHGWLLHDGSGNEILRGGWPQANVANVDYQNDWYNRVYTWLQADDRRKGVWVDTYLMSLENFGASYPAYDQDNVLLWSNDADFQTAQLAFAANAFLGLKNAGYEVIVNAKGVIGAPDALSNDGTRTKDWMDAYHSYVTGMTVENWLQDASGTPQWSASIPYDGDYRHSWNEWLNVHEHANAIDLGFYPTSYTVAAETRETRYYRASYLMNWNGSSNSSQLWNGRDGLDIWNADLAVDVGQPQSPKASIGSGASRCWKRQYEKKLIYVNPNLTTQTPDGHSIPAQDALFL